MLTTESIATDNFKLAGRDSCEVWYDCKNLDDTDNQGILLRLANLQYTGVLLDLPHLLKFQEQIPKRLKKVVDIEAESDIATLNESYKTDEIILASYNHELLGSAKENSFQTCLRVYVDDADSLHDAIALGQLHKFLMIRFRDPTNIPLELVIASLQSSGTVLIKEIEDPQNIDDAIVSLGTMEVGADGVMFSPKTHDYLEKLATKVVAKQSPQIGIQTATILSSKPVGMGYRSCIDLADLFSPEEGMIVGSTSQGGFLCCPEVFFLPYMELRPFRVNAGGVHSYVYNLDNRTDYMTELKAGSEVMVSAIDGKTHRAVVGRMKTEMRPLRLITAQFESGEEINLLLQDDWHVRIFSEAGKPANITELKPGDKVLAHLADPGRHVGIKICENILEK